MKKTYKHWVVLSWHNSGSQIYTFVTHKPTLTTEDVLKWYQVNFHEKFDQDSDGFEIVDNPVLVKLDKYLDKTI